MTTGVLLPVVLIVATFVVVGIAALRRVRQSPTYLMPLTLCTFTTAYVVLPVVWEMIAPFEPGYLLGEIPARIEAGMYPILLYLCCLMAGYFLYLKLSSKRPLLAYVGGEGDMAGSAGVVLIAASCAAFVATMFVSPVTQYGELQVRNVEDPSSLAGLSFLGLPARFLPSLLAVAIASPGFARTYRLLFGFAFVCFLGVSATFGTRAAVIHPIVQLAIALLCFRRWQSAILVVLGAVLISAPLSVASLSYRQSGVHRQTLSEQADGFSSSTTEAYEQGGMLERGVRSLIERADALSNTAFFMEYADMHRPAGRQAYAGVAAALIPRVLWPNKPVPGSYDGTYSGTPQHLLARLRGYSESGTLVAPGAAIMYWQFGWLGVIFGGVLTGALYGLMAKGALSGGDLGKVCFLEASAVLVFLTGESLDRTLMVFLHVYLPLLVVSRLIFRSRTSVCLDTGQGVVPVDPAPARQPPERRAN